MNRLILVLLIIIVGVLYSCKDGANKPVQQDTDELRPEDMFTGTDSLELLYYPDPADQKKYSFRVTNDSTLIAPLVADLGAAAVDGSPCAHLKKAYLYRNGSVYKTIYISDSCRYLAFISNGQPQYRRLSDDTRTQLDAAYLPLMRKVRR